MENLGSCSTLGIETFEKTAQGPAQGEAAGEGASWAA